MIGGQGELEAATEGGAVDERERGGRERVEAVVDRVTQAGQRAADLGVGGQGGHKGEVRAGGEDALHAGDGQGLDLTGLGAGGLGVEDLAEADQGGGAEGGGPTRTLAVVQGDQCQRAGVAGQGVVGDLGARQDFVLGELDETVDIGQGDRVVAHGAPRHGGRL